MEPALGLALVLAGFAAAIGATVAKLCADLYRHGAVVEDAAAAAAGENRQPEKWVQINMPDGTAAVGRANGRFSTERV